MLSDFLKKNIQNDVKYVDYGYAQVEPNHLSAQRTGQIYAQLPAAADIDVLQNGQFVKYDYKEGVCDFTGAGEWMLVFNEIKLYREGQLDCEFAMIKDNYNARIYSPLDPASLNWDAQSRFYNGVGGDGKDTITAGDGTEYPIEKVTAKPDMYELHYNEDPFHIEGRTSYLAMPEGTKMVPRVFKTNVGDIFTTNAVDEETLELGDELSPSEGTKGFLSKGGDGSIVWQVVKVYTLPDRQKAVKIMRIK